MGSRLERLFRIDHQSKSSLQQQLRQQIAAAILDGYITPESALPSSRKMAEQLRIGRNTVMLAYEHLVADGYLVARERSGYFVNPEVLEGVVEKRQLAPAGDAASRQAPQWNRWLRFRPSQLASIRKPADWQSYKYCFIYGQLDQALFPLKNWRECWRDAVSVSAIRDWSVDRYDADDALLVEQIRTRLLPRRGVWVEDDQILVTVGAQHALYLAMRLLLNSRRTLGVENPGYVDARSIAALNPAQLKPLEVDDQGLIPNEDVAGCDCVYVTPSHQSPTTVTMPMERREQLLALAREHDMLLVEDDYEAETSFSNQPAPALKSLDSSDRVIYVGSLSKTLAPGLRLGYLVGSAEFIREARGLRRLMLRHPAANNQRAVALFLARGYHDSLIRSLVTAYRQRAQAMAAALQTYLPNSSTAPSFGGSSFWVRGPEGLDARELAQLAAAEGILIEPGDIFYMQESPPLNCFRLGYSSIETEKIEPGIRRLAELIEKLTQ